MRKYKEIGVLIIFIFFFFVLFKKILFGKVFFRGDIFFMHLPVFEYWRGNFFSLDSILWSPSIFFGYPLASNPQFGLFYPLNLIFVFLFKDTLYALNLLIIFNYFLGLLFTYIYLRELQISKFGSLIGSICFIFNSFMLDYHDSLHALSTMIYLPLLLFIIEKIFNDGKFLYIALSALLVGLQLLAGHSQYFYISWTIVVIYILYKVISQKKSLKKSIIIFSSIFIVGFLIASIQLLPAYGLAQFSSRNLAVPSALSLISERESESLTLQKILGFFFYHFGIRKDSPFQPCFLGTFPFILGTLGVNFKNKKVNGLFFLFIFGFSFLLCLGRCSFFYDLFSYLPWYSYFHDPLKWEFILVFSISVLSALGVENLKKVNFLWVISMIISIFILCLIGFLFLLYHFDLLKIAINDVLFTFAITVFFIIILFVFEKYKIIIKSLIFIFFLAIIFIYSHRSIREIEKSLIDKNRKKLEKFSKVLDDLKQKDNSRIYLHKEANFFSIFSYHLYLWLYNLKPRVDKRYIFSYLDYPMGNNLLPFRIQHCSGYASLIPARYLEFTKTSMEISPIRMMGYPDFIFYPNYLFLSNISIAVVPKIRDNKYFHTESLFEKVYENNQFDIYRVKTLSERAYFAKDFIVEKDRHNILDILKKDTFEPKEVVVLEKALAIIEPRREKKHESYKINIEEYSNTSIDISLETNSSGFLVLLDSFYPGWVAYLDDRNVEILRANYLFRAVYIPEEGRHRIVFRYKPYLFRVGCWISILTLFFLLGSLKFAKKEVF